MTAAEQTSAMDEDGVHVLPRCTQPRTAMSKTRRLYINSVLKVPMVPVGPTYRRGELYACFIVPQS